MLRKAVSILTLVAMLSFLYCSCEQGGMTEVTELDESENLEELLDRAGRIEIENPGEIHNDVLSLYCEKHDPLSGVGLSHTQNRPPLATTIAISCWICTGGLGPNVGRPAEPPLTRSACIVLSCVIRSNGTPVPSYQCASPESPSTRFPISPVK